MERRSMHVVARLVAALVVGGLSLSALADSAEPQQYKIKQTAPSSGSNLRRAIIDAGVVPLDKPYTELTAEEKTLLRADYEKLGSADEPPFPAKGLMPILSAVRRAHEESDLQYKGQLVLFVLIDANGKPEGFKVIETPGADITDAAARALMAQTYKPALCNGTSCEMFYSFHVELTGPDERGLGNHGGTQVAVPHSFGGQRNVGY